MGVRMSDEEAWAFLEAGHTAVLTTLRRDGWPVSLPLWYVVDDRVIYVATPTRSKKVLRIANDDRACLLVEQGEAWVDLAAVEVSARATILESSGESERASAMFAEKYAAHVPSPSGMPGAVKEHYAGQTVIRLDPVGALITWNNAKVRLGR